MTNFHNTVNSFSINDDSDNDEDGADDNDDR